MKASSLRRSARRGNHGLLVDIGSWVGTERKDRLCRSLQDLEDQ